MKFFEYTQSKTVPHYLLDLAPVLLVPGPRDEGEVPLIVEPLFHGARGQQLWGEAEETELHEAATAVVILWLALDSADGDPVAPGTHPDGRGQHGQVVDAEMRVSG